LKKSKNRQLLRAISFILVQIFLSGTLCYAGNTHLKTTLSPQIIINKEHVSFSFLKSGQLNLACDLYPAFAGIHINKNAICLSINCGGKTIKTKTYSRGEKSIPEAILDCGDDIGREGKPLKVHGLVIDGDGLSADEKSRLGSAFWLNNDIVPVKIFESIQGKTPVKVSQHAAALAENSFEIDEVGLVMHKVKIDANRRVLVNPLVTLDEYQQVSAPDKWQKLMRFTQQVKEKKLNMVFVNSTAQGGGVALMRHALIRLYQLLGVDADWQVMDLDMEQFGDIPDITKKKMHNALQNTNVPGFDSKLTAHEKKRLREWTEYNFNLMEPRLKQADVIVIDDYQPSGLIPLVKKKYPHIKIIYRSHIQIRSELTDLPKDDLRSTRSNWEYILDNLLDAAKKGFNIEAFVSHPVDAFIPEDISRHNKMIIKKGAASDISKNGKGGFDGLNKYKHFSEGDKQYYLNMFNKVLALSNKRISQIADLGMAENDLSAQQKNLLKLLKKDKRLKIKGRDDPRLTDFLSGFQQSPLDTSRPYILQISRFDPAKGIPDLLKAYKIFRDKLKHENPEQDIPQLVIAGHGAIDDPEGMPLYNEYLLEAYLDYKDLFKDIKMARIGHNDQILGVIAVNAWAGMQLSTAEGYEIKISELGALEVPTIITDLPGPSDQATSIMKGADRIIGSTFIVSPDKDKYEPEYGDKEGDSQEIKIANRLEILFKDKEFYELIKANARKHVREDVDTVQNAIDWLWMALEAVDSQEGISGDGKRIVALIEETPRIFDMTPASDLARNQKEYLFKQKSTALFYEQAI
jgi:glycosyltransferase involved in cell wall biosynthesis